MKKIFLFSLVPFLWINQTLSQSPFVQENNSEKKSKRTIDTVRSTIADKVISLENQIDGISKLSINKIQFDTLQPTIILNNFSKQILQSSKKLADAESAKEDFESKFQSATMKIRNLSGKSEKEKSAKKLLQTQIEHLQVEIKKSNAAIESYRNEMEEYKKLVANLDSNIKKTSFERHLAISQKLQLQSDILSMDLQKFRKTLKETEAELNRLEKEVDNRLGRNSSFLSAGDDSLVYTLNKEMTLLIREGELFGNGIGGELDGLEKSIGNLNDTLEYFKAFVSRGFDAVDLKVLRSIEDGANSTAEEINKKIEKVKSLFSKSNQDLSNFAKTIGVNLLLVRNVYSKYKVNETPSEENLKTLAGITQPLNQSGKLVPNISILGYKGYSSEERSWAAQLKLFVSPTSNDKSVLSSSYRLFIPEASSYGFMADFSFGFIPSDKSYKIDSDTRQPIKKLGLNFGSYYLAKSLINSIDSSNFTTGMLQFKVGAQYVVIGKVLSLYANVNPFFMSDGIEKFKENYQHQTRLQAFVDFGLNCYLNLAQDAKSGFFIDFDLGFISVGSDVKSIVKTEDPLIPHIKISLVKGFNF